MKRKNSLTRAIDIERVKRTGISFANPLMALIAAPNSLPFSRFAIAAGRSIGNAVKRNRAKRQLCSCLDALFETINPGWDFIVYGRIRISSAKYYEIRLAMNDIMQEAGLFTPGVKID